MTSILPKSSSVKLLKRLTISETSCGFVLLARITSASPLEEVIMVISQPATRASAAAGQVLPQPRSKPYGNGSSKNGEEDGFKCLVPADLYINPSCIHRQSANSAHKEIQQTIIPVVCILLGKYMFLTGCKLVLHLWAIRTVPATNNFKLNSLKSTGRGGSAANNQDKNALVTLISRFR